MTDPAPSAGVARPPTGGAVAVAPGVVWVRMPLPYALDHVNLWLLEDGDGWTLVDTGQDDRATRAAWAGLERTALRGRPVRRIVSTHHHPDHLGLSGWLARRWGAELWCTRTEWLSARAWSLRSPREIRATARAYYRRAGVPERELPRLLACGRSYPEHVSAPATFRRLQGGDALRVGGVGWRVIVGGGHAPEHACLHAPERGIFISGDQVLPDITPNVSIWPTEPEEDPLSDFLRTLDALRALPAETLVLPSHGRPFVGLRRRLDELALHHRARLAAVLDACERPRTAWEVMGVLFERNLDPHQTTFAIGEALAHLNHLERAGRLHRIREARGPDRWTPREGSREAARMDAQGG